MAHHLHHVGIFASDIDRSLRFYEETALLLEGDPVVNSSAGTARQRMIRLLEGMEMSAIDLSQELGMSEKEVYEHLPHVARSAGARGKRLVIMPAQCLKCGYVFRDRRRFTPPGRCPRCRETHLQRPAYTIE